LSGEPSPDLNPISGITFVQRLRDYFPSLLHIYTMSSSPVKLNDGTTIPPIGFGTGQTNSFSEEAGLTLKGPAYTAQNVPISSFLL
jgi:hypothetical protein